MSVVAVVLHLMAFTVSIVMKDDTTVVELPLALVSVPDAV